MIVIFSYWFRSLTCKKTYDLDDLLESHKIYRNPDSIRHGTHMIKNAFLAGALICSIGIYWKKKRMFIPKRGQYNVITLNQSVLLVILIYLNTMFSYLLTPTEHKFVFFMELMKIIFIENIFFKCLIPVYLLLCCKQNYAILWVDRKQKKMNYFMTPPSFIARPVVSKYQTNNHNKVMKSREIEKPYLRDAIKRPKQIIITVHAPDQGCSLTQIES